MLPMIGVGRELVLRMVLTETDLYCSIRPPIMFHLLSTHASLCPLLCTYHKCQKKWCAFAETTSITLLHHRYKWSSGRSLNKAAPHFRNLCVYKLSDSRKKPSDLLHSCTENPHWERPSEC